jgi:predicted negative regulator of RcsB-dependent stress response
VLVSDHLTRKELKQDKIHDAIEHGAEAVYSHSQTAAILAAIAIGAVLIYGGWKFYSDRQTVLASAALDEAMKVYNAPIRQANQPVEAGELTYGDHQTRAQDATTKFAVVANKYSSTNPGRLARYYQALTLLDLEKQNQSIEELKKVVGGSDKELSAMAQYQLATIYARTGKTDDAIKTYRAVADAKSVLVPRPLVLLELADLLRQTNPGEATILYQQIKKDYPSPAVSERADRGLDLLAPKS